MTRIFLLLPVIALLLLPSALNERPAEASPLSVATISLEGDSLSVPSAPFRTGGTYLLADLGGSQVNENGDVVFVSTTSAGPPPEPCALLLGSVSGPPSIIAADGDEAPPPYSGQPLNVCDPPLALPSGDPLVNNGGDVAYEARLMGIGRWALWVRPFGSPFPLPVAVESDTDPLAGTYGRPALLDFNDNGYVLFEADSSGVPTLWLWDTASVSKVVTEGESLVGLGGISVGTLGGGGGGGGTATMNSANDVAWRVTTTGGGGGGGGGIYVGTASSPTKVVQATDNWFTGDPVGAIDFTEVSAPRILDDGSVVFRAIADSPYGAGYFLADPDGSGGYTYEKRVLEADPNPETGSTWGGLVAPSARNGEDGEVMLSANDGTPSETLYLYPSYDRVVGVGDTSPAGSPYTNIKSASVNVANVSISGVVAGAGGPGCVSSCDGIFAGGTTTDPANKTMTAYPDFDGDGLGYSLEANTNSATCGLDSNRDGSIDFSFDLDSDGSCDVDYAVPDVFVEVDYMDCTVASAVPDNNDPKDVDNDFNLLEPDGMPDDDLPGAVCGGGDTHNHKPLGGIIEGGASGPLGVYSCEDGIDNDTDTLTDLDDPDCSVVAAFADAPVHNVYSNEDGIATCGDGVDNGGGDAIDGLDGDCWAVPGNIFTYDASRIEDKSVGTCNDGLDNNGDGKMDAGLDLSIPRDYDYNDPGESPPDDDCTGINLHVVVDEALAHADFLDWQGAKVVGSPCVNGVGYHPNHSAFELVKAFHFGGTADSAATLAAKKLLFHYSLSTHKQDGSTTSSGCGEMPGNDFYVSLGGWSAPTGKEFASGFMHELGHNLNLCHGGPIKLARPQSQCDWNYKPNYLSVMNYTFSFRWTPDGQLTARKLDFSRVALPPGDPTIGGCPAAGAGNNMLKENGGLAEPQGIDCGIASAVPSGWPNTAYTYVSGPSCPFKVVPSTGGIDWNLAGGLTNAVTAPINDPIVAGGSPPACNTSPIMTSLKGYNDWPFLLYNFRGTPGYGDGLPTAPVQDEPGIVPPPDADGDGIPDGSDNCPSTPNPNQLDVDLDSIGDACDTEGPPGNTNGTAGTDDCTDGVDNDGDAFTDGADPGCSDTDGDGQPDVTDACPTTFTTWTTPLGDTDCDSFTNAIEAFVGTDAGDSCANTAASNDEADDRWPADTNDNQFVNVFDVVPYIPALNSVAPGPPYTARLDLNMSGSINVFDVVPFIQLLNKACLP